MGLEFNALNKWRRILGNFVVTQFGGFPILSNDPKTDLNVGFVKETDTHQVVTMVSAGDGVDVINLVKEKASGTEFIQNVTFPDADENIGYGLNLRVDDGVNPPSATNILEILINRTTGNVNYRYTQIRVFADHTAADADNTLLSKAIYKITGDRGIYQKP